MYLNSLFCAELMLQLMPVYLESINDNVSNNDIVDVSQSFLLLSHLKNVLVIAMTIMHMLIDNLISIIHKLD